MKDHSRFDVLFFWGGGVRDGFTKPWYVKISRLLAHSYRTMLGKTEHHALALQQMRCTSTLTLPADPFIYLLDIGVLEEDSACIE